MTPVRAMNIQKNLVNTYTFLNLMNQLRSFPRDPGKTRQRQLKKLRRLLSRAWEDHEFYRDRMADAGLDPHLMNNLEELEKLPPLTKEEYRSFTNDLLSRHPDKYRSWYFDQTSGSSGTPLRIVRSWPERGYVMAKWLRAIYMNGYSCRHRTLRIIAPHRMSGKKDTFLQHLGLYRFHMVSYFASGREMAEAFQKISPDFFYANRTQAAETAQYILDSGMNIRKPIIYSVGAEVIDPNSRNLFNQVFGKENFFENYGCEEAGMLAFQMRGEEGLHFCHDTNILELINPDGTPARTRGEVLITDLEIDSFPLVRYRLGDTVETFDRDAGLPGIKVVRGRTEDWLCWKDGTKTSNVFFYEILGRFSSRISRFRIVQENFDMIRIFIVVLPCVAGKKERDILRDEIVSCMKQEMRPEIAYRVEYVKTIPPDPSGKMGIISSKVRPPRPMDHSSGKKGRSGG